MTYKQLYQYGIENLEEVSIIEASLDARRLLEFYGGILWQDLILSGELEVEKKVEDNYKSAIEKRKKRIPLQYITGVQEFMGLEFKVSKDVLIPRQDTEILVEEVMKYKQEGMRILDMCTGSGCILISLLHYGNTETGVGVDISAKALEIAKENSQKILNQEGEKRISFVESNLFAQVEGKFDLIVSNPPYIESEVIPNLMPEVSQYEPHIALDGDADGLSFYRKIIKAVPTYFHREGMLFLEIGNTQGEAVSKLMLEAGYKEVEVIKDYAKEDRVVIGTLI